MHLTDFFIRRAITTTLMISAVAGFGLLSYLSLPVSNLPEVEYPTIQVTAQLPGANPDVMASHVATPLESEFSMIPGIENMTSSSSVGETDIRLLFNLNRSVDAAAQDVQAAISRAEGSLPPNMPAPPSYSKVNASDSPILWLEMSSKTISWMNLRDTRIRCSPNVSRWWTAFRKCRFMDRNGLRSGRKRILRRWRPTTLILRRFALRCRQTALTFRLERYTGMPLTIRCRRILNSHPPSNSRR